MSVQVRRGGIADLDVLVRHRHRMWREIGGRTLRELREADPIYARWARREMRAGRLVAFVAERPRGRVIGSCGVWLQEQQPRPRWKNVRRLPYLMSMYTEPRHRRTGVATVLATAAVGWASRRGFPRIFLHASPMGRAVYERLGFEAGTEMRLELGPTHRAHRPR